jgi:hypothetical protein
MISIKNTTFPKLKKIPKLSTFTQRFGRGITRKRPTKGACIHPQSNPKENGLKSTTRNSPTKGPKITKKENGGNNTRP